MFERTMIIDGAKTQTFYRTMESARHDDPSILYEDHGIMKVEGMGRTTTVESDNHFSVVGYEPMFDDSIKEFNLEIVRHRFNPVSNFFFALVYHSGYYNDIICGEDSICDIQEFGDTEAEVKEKAKQEQYSNLKKNWECECGPLGYTGGYLSISKIYIKA